MIRAIICDDERAALNIIRHFIEAERMPIEIAGTAQNGREALALAQSVRPDLIFMDINMPFMNGFEVIERLRNRKIIVITAYDSFEYAQRALRLGVCDIIAKPIDFEQLRQAIARAIGWRFTGNDAVDAALTWLYAHFNEKVELKALAELAYCTESHLARVFKKETGLSVISYVHKLRIDRSVMLMAQGGKSIKEISEEVGYNNLNHFYKYFEQYMNSTPAAYMKGLRGEGEE
ncbi:MAG: response regulator [Clostridia bacterium]|nr:response regulator [Clostridia bacterium]